MAKHTIKYAAVHGSGEFPIDMLRYDQCWPICEKHAHLFSRDNGERAIVVATHAHNFTPARWHSFGWTIALITSDRYEAERQADHLKGES